MDSKRIKLERSLHRSEDVIEEILLRLPVKSLLRFRCVSKRWRSLIDSERFIEIHLQMSTKNTAFRHHRVIISQQQDLDLPKQSSLQPLSEVDKSINLSCIPGLTKNFSVKDCVVGEHNGLLCLFSYCKSQSLLSISFWNPATRISKELPRLFHEELPRLFYERTELVTVLKIGFGWDGRSGAYKVFAISTQRGVSKGNLYSSKTKSWKTVGSGCIVRDGIGTFASGKIYWLPHCPDHIESFNLEKEEFGKIELPVDRNEYREPGLGECSLGEVGGCLHMMSSRRLHHLDLWAMKEYGVKESWEKLISICTGFTRGERRIFPGHQDGEILVTLFRGRWLVYYLNRKYDMFFAAKDVVYIESLVSPLEL